MPRDLAGAATREAPAACSGRGFDEGVLLGRYRFFA